MSMKFGVLAVAALMVFSAPAMADEELMNLFPSGRAKHQDKMDENAMKYLARGQDYVDHLYATGGEEPMSEPDDMDFESADDVVSVDVGEVANIIKDNAPTRE